MVWLPRRAQKGIFFTPFSPYSAQKKIFLQNCLCHIQSSISGQSHTKNQKNLWPSYRDELENAYFSHLFRHFRPKKIFSCKTAYAIFKVVYQASHIPKIRKIYGLVAETCSKTHIFHTFFAIFGPKKFFLAKLPMPYLKQYIRLVTYQKSEKSMAWLPRNAQKCIFFTPFSPFLAKKNFFSKIRLRQFFGTIKSYLDAKNQKKLWSGSSGIHFFFFFLLTDLELKSYKEHSWMHSTIWQLLP